MAEGHFPGSAILKISLMSGSVHWSAVNIPMEWASNTLNTFFRVTSGMGPPTRPKASTMLSQISTSRSGCLSYAKDISNSASGEPSRSRTPS